MYASSYAILPIRHRGKYVIHLSPQRSLFIVNNGTIFMAKCYSLKIDKRGKQFWKNLGPSLFPSAPEPRFYGALHGLKKSDSDS